VRTPQTNNPAGHRLCCRDRYSPWTAHMHFAKQRTRTVQELSIQAYTAMLCSSGAHGNGRCNLTGCAAVTAIPLDCTHTCILQKNSGLTQCMSCQSKPIQPCSVAVALTAMGDAISLHGCSGASMSHSLQSVQRRSAHGICTSFACQFFQASLQ
jgi:hypothetical protein